MEDFYRKSKGNAGLDGVQFQINLLTVFLLNALRNLKDWRISTENEDAGKFDDVVIELSDGSAVLLQAKHKDNKRITKDQLLSDNARHADFSLPKYFLSYEEVKNKITVNSIIICTNADVDKKKLKDILAVERASPDSILHYEAEGCSFITFNENILSDLRKNSESYYDKNLQGKGMDKEVILDENLKDFLEKLQFFSNYPSGDNLNKIIDQLLSRLPDSKLWNKTSSHEINRKVEDWFKYGRGEYLNETRAIAMFCEIKSDQYCKSLKDYNVLFERNDLTFTEQKRVFHVTTKGQYLLQAIKIYRSLQHQEKQILCINPEDGFQVQKHAVEAFQKPKYVFLVLICLNNEIKTMTDRLNEILSRSKYKKVILVTENSKSVAEGIGAEDDVIEVDGSVRFDDLTRESRENLITKDIVSFQGNGTCIQELIGTSTVDDHANAIDPEILERLVKGKNIKVGTESSGLDEDTARYYVHRMFERDIQKYDPVMSDKVKKEKIPEKNIIGINESIILISDTAGMGKSTVLTNLAADTKEKYPHLWVIRVELSNYTRFLRNCLRKNKKTVTINELLNSDNSTKMTNALEKHVFSMKEKVVVLLDGFDEISPDYTGLILSLIRECQEAPNIAKMIVTTRPHMDNELEAILRVQPFTLQPFTKEDQVAFLTNYWMHTLHLQSTSLEKCEKYSRILLTRMSSWMKGETNFAGVPLQLRMLAEIFEENIRWSASMNWDGCKEFLEGDEDEPVLPERMKITKLYEMFIKKKLDIFMDKANPSGTPAANHSLYLHFREYFVTHQSLAIFLIFKVTMVLDERFYKLFSHYQYNQNVETNILQIGIVQQLNGNLGFFHRSFAEYFVAKSILEVSELDGKSINQDLDFQQFFIDEILCNPQFTVIRAFLESVLEDLVDTLPSDIFENYRLHATGDPKTWKHRSELIHLLASEGCVSILRMILKCIHFKVIVHQEISIPEQKCEENENINTLDLLQGFVEKGGVDLKDESGSTPLRYAAIQGRHEMTKFLVRQGANINAKDGEGWTPMHLGAQHGYIETIEFLLENGADLNPENNHGLTVFHSAARGGHLDIIKLFVELGVNLNVTDKTGHSAMHIAAEYGHLGFVEYLVEQGMDVTIGNNFNTIPLQVAATEGHLEVVAYFVKRGVDVNFKNDFGSTSLHYACSCGHMDIVKFLTEHGADINIGDDKGFTPLHAAAAGSKLLVVEYLVGQGAEVNKVNAEGFTAIHAAVTVGHLEGVKFLVQHGDASIKNNIGVTALISACGTGFLDIVKFLANNGSDVKLKYRDSITALHLAAECGKLEVVKYLLDCGLDMDAVTDYGYTPLYVAAVTGQLEVIKHLVESGADVNLASNSGVTPLMAAAASGKVDTVSFLATCRGKDGLTALHSAAAEGHLDLVRYLVESGADVRVRDGEGVTPLQRAANCGRLDVVKFFMERNWCLERGERSGDTEVK